MNICIYICMYLEDVILQLDLRFFVQSTLYGCTEK